MTEAEERKGRAQAREFPETIEIIGRLRDALAERLFQTPVDAQAEREAIYLRVQTLDAMTSEMQIILNNQAGEKAIEDYVKSLATTKPGSQV